MEVHDSSSPFGLEEQPRIVTLQSLVLGNIEECNLILSLTIVLNAPNHEFYPC